MPEPEPPKQPALPGEALPPIQQRSDLPEVGNATPAPEQVPLQRQHGGHAKGGAMLALAVSALGVVFGDIGTSPLYALKECFNGHHGVEPTRDNVLGVLSLVFWSMTFVVTCKYLAFVMRADNRGEGGILALQALVSRQESAAGTSKASRRALLMLGLFGAALLYGDGVITPAISVLSAVEGVTVAAPVLTKLVVPVTVLILFGLFFIQRRGTALVGSIFGPVMVVWFLCIGLLGIRGLTNDPSVLWALSPVWGVRFFLANGVHGFLVLGAVVLCITGGEALYADMGHFGKKPIQLAWLTMAMPPLVLNYFGQGAVLLANPAARQNPFFFLSPGWALYPLVAISTLATIVASQALISGAFSLTNQAVQLGYSPRVTVLHTSSTEIGQIYVPEVNWAIGGACIALVLGFKSSDNLAAAYGIAVTGTMTITTLLFHRVMRDLWVWPRWKVYPLTTIFLITDLSFFSSNLIKVEEGGWFPLAVGVGVFTVLSTWKRGREALAQVLRDAGLPLDLFLADVERRKPVRVAGTAVFMTSSLGLAPPVLLHHLKHNKVLHERVVFMSILNEEIPQVAESERLFVRDLGNGFLQVVVHYGFMEQPDVMGIIRSLSDLVGDGPWRQVRPMETTFYLGRETLLSTGTSSLATWRKKLFILMSRNSVTASAFFGLPANRVVELGAQIEL